MLLSPLEDPGLTVLPTHRVTTTPLPPFEKIKALLGDKFDFTEFPYTPDTKQTVRTKFIDTLRTNGRNTPTFGLALKGDPRYITLALKPAYRPAATASPRTKLDVSLLVFHGYWGRDDLTAAAFDDEGFFRTGDLFQLEDDVHYRFVGRARDLIVRGGMKIAPEGIEGLLVQHPKIADVAVVGMGGERLEDEQTVTAVVVPVKGETVDLAELRAFLRDIGVAGYKEPRRIVVVDALPRNPLGKVLKRDIRSSLTG